MVLVAGDEDAGPERRLAGRLRRHDRFLRAPGRNRWALYNVGAQAACAPWLFLSELHCVPEPNALTAMLHHLAATGDDGARGTTIGLSSTPAGAVEQDVYERSFRIGEEDGHWQKVLVHGFAVRRDAFLAVGGFRPELWEFAPWKLAMDLHETGAAVGLARESAVRHVYTGSLRAVLRQVTLFGLGHARAVVAEPELVHRYVAEAPEWASSWGLTRAGSRRVMRDVLASKEPRAAAAELAAAASVALLGPRAAVLQAAAATGRHAVRTRFGTTASRTDALLRLWRDGERLGRLFVFSRARLDAPSHLPRVDHIDVVDGAVGRTAGFGAVEGWQGSRFRWSSPASTVRFASRPGHRRGGRATVRWHLLPIRSVDGLDVRVVADGHRVAPAHTTLRPDLLEAQVPASTATVTVVCPEWREARHGSEHRRIALPVTGAELLGSRF